MKNDTEKAILKAIELQSIEPLQHLCTRHKKGSLLPFFDIVEQNPCKHKLNAVRSFSEYCAVIAEGSTIKNATHYIYFLFDNIELVYIGCTTRRDRLIAHNKTKQYDSFLALPIFDGTGFEWEGKLIQAIKTKYNKEC